MYSACDFGKIRRCLLKSHKTSFLDQVLEVPEYPHVDAYNGSDDIDISFNHIRLPMADILMLKTVKPRNIQ